MGTKIEEKRGTTQNYNSKKVAAKPKKNLASIMKVRQKQAKASQKAANEAQEFIKWALQNCKNQGDLDAIREVVNTNGTAKQRKQFEKLEKDFAPGLTKAKRRQQLAARTTNPKLSNNESFRQAVLNAESVDDLKALEKEYDKKLPQSLKTTFEQKMTALEKTAAQATTQHAEMQGVYNGLFGYGNGKHPSVTPLGTAKPSASSGMTWAKYTNGKYSGAEVSGVVRADKLAQETIAQNIKHAEMQGVYNGLFGYGNGKHPSVTPLGTAKPSASSGMTWAKYTNGKYSGAEVSGVVRADKLAQETIAQNIKHAEMQNFYEELFKDYEYKPQGENPIVIGGNASASGEKPPIVQGNNPSVSGEKPPVAQGNKPSVEAPVNNSGKPSNTRTGKGKGRLKMPKLGKKGKFALATLALGLIGAGIAYLTTSKKTKLTTPSGRELQPGFVPTDSTTIDTTNVKPMIADTNSEQGTDSLNFAPIPSSLLEEKVDTVEQKVVSQIPRDNATGKYIVKKGDNCWNIAKAELIKEKYGEIPSDAAILERTYKIIERNDLHFEKDKYTVLIYPKDTLNIKM